MKRKDAIEAFLKKVFNVDVEGNSSISAVT